MSYEIDGVPCLLMRGGTSKGAYFLADDLPAEESARDDLLLRIMGSPDARQIDGIGGAHPLTSKVAVVQTSTHPDADVDYLFLQVVVDQAVVSNSQTCGNIIAGVAPFALERGLVQISGQTTDVRIRIVNPTQSFAIATVQTPDGQVRYSGDTFISGVPFPAAAEPIAFPAAGRALYPTGSSIETIANCQVTCIDAGMPVVLLRAVDFGITGYETPTQLESNAELRSRLETIRCEAGTRMGLGDVSATTVPKMSLLAAPRHGGLVSTRTFIPHRVHTSIGVLGAVSVAAGCLDPSSVAGGFGLGIGPGPVRIEHPTGWFDVMAELQHDGHQPVLIRSAVVRTARKLFDGRVWPREKDGA